MKNHLLLFLSVLACTGAWAQKLAINSTTYYGGSRWEEINRSIPTGDGGLLAMGYSSSKNFFMPSHITDTLFGNVLVAKYDSTGALTWGKQYGGSGSDRAYAGVQTSDGGYVIAAATTSLDGDIPNRIGSNALNTADIWVLRLNSNGSLLWSKIYGGSSGEGPGDVIETTDGGFLILSETSSSDSDMVGRIQPVVYTDWSLIKTDGQGNRQWRRIIGGTSFETYNSRLLIAPGGGYYLVGSSLSHDSDLTEDNIWPGGVPAQRGPVFLKLSDSGQVEWCKRYGGTKATGVNDVMLDLADTTIITLGYTSSNDFYFTGNHLDAVGNPTDDFYLMRVDKNGDFASCKLYGDAGRNRPHCFSSGPSGVFMIGSGDEHGLGAYTDVRLSLISPAGDSLTHLVLSGQSAEEPRGMYWRGGEWIVLGNIRVPPFAQGAVGPGGNPAGHIFVSKVEQWPASISKMNKAIGSLLLTPNPASDVVTAELSEVVSGSLAVISSDGRTALQQTLQGKRQIQFSTAGLPAGTYIVTITDGATNRRFSSPLIVR